MELQFFNLFIYFTILGFLGSLTLWVVAFCGYLIFKAFWNSTH